MCKGLMVSGSVEVEVRVKVLQYRKRVRVLQHRYNVRVKV